VAKAAVQFRSKRAVRTHDERASHRRTDFEECYYSDGCARNSNAGAETAEAIGEVGLASAVSCLDEQRQFAAMKHWVAFGAAVGSVGEVAAIGDAEQD
jgi:hypothetical protein